MNELGLLYDESCSGPGILVLMSEFVYYDDRSSGTRCW